MWFQETSWTELRSSFDSNHFGDSRRKTLWNALWLQMKNSFSYRIPSLLGCLLTVHQVQWNPRFGKPKQHHVCLSIPRRWVLCSIWNAALPFSSLEFLPSCWIAHFWLRRSKMHLLDCEHLLSRAAVASCRPQTTLREEGPFVIMQRACWNLFARLMVYMEKETEVWLMLGLVIWPRNSAKDCFWCISSWKSQH